MLFNDPPQTLDIYNLKKHFDDKLQQFWQPSDFAHIRPEHFAMTGGVLARVYFRQIHLDAAPHHVC